jgi:spermidine/putrescine transport system substrate-binding protein
MTNTVKSGLVSRRAIVKAAAALGAVGVASPWIVRGSLASSGVLNFMGWAGYDDLPKVFAAFEKKTGVKVNFTGFGSQDEMFAQAKTGGAAGAFDISEPTSDRVQSWVENDFLQPWSDARLNLDGVEPAFLQGGSAATSVVGGKRYGATSVWGSESLTFNTKEAPLVFGKASLMDLWDDKYAGKLTLRGHSGLVAAGRALEAKGQLPHKFDDSFVDEAKMTANYDAILKFVLAKRKNVAQFWSNENEAQGAFRTNGCTIGMCWDTSAAALAKEGFPIGYIAPVEGTVCWLQNFVLLKGAKNIEQAHAWIAWINSPEGGAAYASAFGAYSTTRGAIELADATQKKFFQAAFPGDALKNVWWWPTQPGWFVTKRTAYAKKFMSA